MTLYWKPALFILLLALLFFVLKLRCQPLAASGHMSVWANLAVFCDSMNIVLLISGPVVLTYFCVLFTSNWSHMPHYIRFLKPARVADGRVTALITLTTDLGDTFLAEERRLAASIRIIDNGTGLTVTVLQHSCVWRATDRQLQIAIGPVPNNRKSKSTHRAELAVRPADSVKQSFDSLELDEHGIVSAWSPPFTLEDGIQAEKLVERRFHLGESPALRIWEETGNSIARHIWCVVPSSSRHCLVRVVVFLLDGIENGKSTSRDAAFACVLQINRSIKGIEGSVLPRLFDHVQDEGSNRILRVIELGTGCGIVGIALAQRLPRCAVVLTDLQEAQDIANRNAKLAQPALGSSIQFEVLDWDEPLPEQVRAQTYDLIIVSDCTYNADSLPTLVRTLKALTEISPEAAVLVCLKRRHESEDVFFTLMEGAGFERHRTSQPDARVAGEIETHCFFAQPRGR